MSTKNRYFSPVIFILVTLALSSCGGGSSSTTGSGGSPSLSEKCLITNLALSSGTTAILSKVQDRLSASVSLSLAESRSIETSSNLENAGGDDWIEGVPVMATLSAGVHTFEIVYDLNSPKKSTSDRYTKLSLTVNLGNDEACVANQAVDITLTP